MTRSWIFQRGYPVDGPQVKVKLNPTSAVPTHVGSHFSTLSIYQSPDCDTQNVFSLWLFHFGFNFFFMFVPDLLHKFELGMWKHIFTHLVWILYAIGDNLVQRLNKRQVLGCVHIEPNIESCNQILPSPNLWKRHHTSILYQRIWDEEICRPGFWGSFASELNYHYHSATWIHVGYIVRHPRLWRPSSGTSRCTHYWPPLCPCDLAHQC